MKHIFLSAAFLLLTLNVSAQDATQAKGSWYLGSGDATQLLQLFSTGVDIAPTVGYAVADNIVVQGSMSGPTDALNMNLGLAYFMGDVWVGAQASDLTGDMDAGINVGYWIDFKDVLYITPNLQYSFGLPDGSTDYMNIGIGFGAKF
jgi:hypothetical protein